MEKITLIEIYLSIIIAMVATIIIKGISILIENYKKSKQKYLKELEEEDFEQACSEAARIIQENSEEMSLEQIDVIYLIGRLVYSQEPVSKAFYNGIYLLYDKEDKQIILIKGTTTQYISPEKYNRCIIIQIYMLLEDEGVV